MARERKLKPVDWDAVAIDIRAGKLTDRQIGEKHGRSHGAIQAYARKRGISRDLSERIQQKTTEKLATAKLAKIKLAKRPEEISQEPAPVTVITAEEQAIEIAATVNSTIIIQQQGRIARRIALVSLLAEEVEQQTAERALFEKLGEFLRCPDENNRDALNDVYMKSISTPSRVDMVKKLVEAEDKLITMEGKAHRLDREAPPATNQEDRDVPPEFYTALEDFKVKVRGAVKDTTAAA